MASTRVLADPVKMIRSGAPRLIQNDDELEHYEQALLKLLEKDDPSKEESAAISLLTLLIDKYNTDRHAIPAAAPVEVLRFMMSQHHLQQKDLVPEFGAKSIVSEVLSGKRNLTLEQIQRLSRRFSISPEAFLSEPAARRRKSLQKTNSRVA